MFNLSKPEWYVKAKTRLSTLEAKAEAATYVNSRMQEKVITPLQERRKNLIHNKKYALNTNGFDEEIAEIDNQLNEARIQCDVSHKVAGKLNAQVTRARRALEQASPSEQKTQLTFRG